MCKLERRHKAVATTPEAGHFPQAACLEERNFMLLRNPRRFKLVENITFLLPIVTPLFPPCKTHDGELRKYK